MKTTTQIEPSAVALNPEAPAASVVPLTALQAIVAELRRYGPTMLFSGFDVADQIEAAVAAAGEQQPVAWRAEEDARKLFERVHCGGNKEFARRNSTTGDYVVVSCADAWAGWWSALSSGYASPVAQGWQPIREKVQAAQDALKREQREYGRDAWVDLAIANLGEALALLPEPPR